MGTHTAAANAGDAPGSDSSQGHITGYGSRPYRSYVLNMLLLVYILNFIDRGLLSVVAGKLKVAIGASDLGWGFISGFGFAFLYTIVGIPLARVAEQRHRVWIMAICLVAWSAFTAACGLSADVVFGGGFVLTGLGVLLLFRIGVGIGEAGCTPPATSVISDYFPRERRSTALGWYAMGVTLGTASANIIGGPIVDNYGWQATFFILGLPGVLVAVVLKLTVKEPPRGYSDAPGTGKVQRATWAETFGALMSKPSYWWMLGATTIASFCGYAIANFQSLYLQRTFHVTVGDAALYITGPAYLLGACGTLLTGWLAERIGKRSTSSIAWLPGIGMILSVPFYMLAFTLKEPLLGLAPVVLCTLFLGLGHFVKYGYLAAQYTISQGVVPLRMRATATAILIFAQNMLGYGLGPLFAGGLSDWAFNNRIGASEYVQEAGPNVAPATVLNRHMCDASLQVAAANNKAPADKKKPMAEVLGGMTPAMDEARYGFCDKANQEATSFAMLVISGLYALGGLIFFICMLYLKRDFEAAQAGQFGSGKVAGAIGAVFVGIGAAGLWATPNFLRPGHVVGDVIFRTGTGAFTLPDLIYWGAYVLAALVIAVGIALLTGHFRRKPEGTG
jgi:MFS family permease